VTKRRPGGEKRGKWGREGEEEGERREKEGDNAASQDCVPATDTRPGIV